jgi:hypothetical protein
VGDPVEHEPPPQLRLVCEPVERCRCRVCIAWRHEQPALCQHVADAPYVGRDHRRARRVRLDQHLRQPFGQRYVQERVTGPIQLPQPWTVCHFAEHVDRALEPALRDGTLECVA